METEVLLHHYSQALFIMAEVDQTAWVQDTSRVIFVATCCVILIWTHVMLTSCQNANLYNRKSFL